MKSYISSKTKDLLEAENDSNDLHGVITILAELLRRDLRTIEVAYLCSDSAVQVSKLPDEGRDFCGYRNIQMLLLALTTRNKSADAGTSSPEPLKPTIPQLQEAIEQAWDAGFNSHGRDIIGNLKGTRKHIGTAEAEALLLSRGTKCTGQAFRGTSAWCELLDAVEAYFISGSTGPAAKEGIRCTSCLPLFLQRAGHSFTIVGIVRMRTGSRMLLTFDPGWQPPASIRKGLDAQHCSSWTSRIVLKCYKKNERYLKRFTEYELLSLD